MSLWSWLIVSTDSLSEARAAWRVLKKHVVWSFSLNRLQTRLDSTLCSRLYSDSYVLRPRSVILTLRSFHPSRFQSVCLLQASNGNDPWSVWNADPSGGSNNNWASNPEGTQTGKTAGDPWGSGSQGHPQAYQGPGKDSFTVTLKLYY